MNENRMNENKEIIKLLKSIKIQKELLQSEVNLGIISTDCVRYELDMMNKKEYTLKEKFVFANHVTKDGYPRSISQHMPSERNNKAYFVTKMPDGRKVKANTYEGLIYKLYDFYTNGLSDMSLDTIFKAALNEKAITENPKQNTLYKISADYNRFITSEIKAKDIRTFTEIDIKKYIQEWVNAKHPKKKAFLSFKGVLNLIFGYACSHKIISKNPLENINNAPYMKSCDTSKAKPEDKILSTCEIDILKDEVRYRMALKKYGDYYVNGYAMLFAIETGVRVGELCALKWEDIKETSIHIHSQQLSKRQTGGTEYYIVPYTKNEKGESEDGREFPLTRNIKNLLAEIKEKQDKYYIDSEFIFCDKNGDWIKKDAYITFLRRLCQSKNFNVTNNHALRMSLNSNVLIPKGISVADRAAMLGHSIETNLRHYSFAQKDYLENVRSILDYDCDDFTRKPLGNPREPLKIVNFSEKNCSKHLKNQAF